MPTKPEKAAPGNTEQRKKEIIIMRTMEAIKNLLDYVSDK
jgi:hypothetical protein